MKKVNFKKLISRVSFGALAFILLFSMPLNAADYTYFSKLQSEPVYDNNNDVGGGVATPWDGGHGESSSQSKLIGFNKNCTSAFVSRCNQDNVGFEALNEKIEDL